MRTSSQTLTTPVFLMVILTILVALWMPTGPTGRAMYAVGGNKRRRDYRVSRSTVLR